MTEFPLVPVRDIVVFPGMSLPLFIGRSRSLAAIARAADAGTPVLVVAQRRGAVDQPAADELYGIGSLSTVGDRVSFDDKTMKVHMHATARARILGIEDRGDYITARAEVLGGAPGERLEAAREKLAPVFAKLFPSIATAARPEMDRVVAAMQAVLEGEAADDADRLERLRAALEGLGV